MTDGPWTWQEDWPGYELYRDGELIITSDEEADDDSGLMGWVECDFKWRQYIVDALNAYEKVVPSG